MPGILEALYLLSHVFSVSFLRQEKRFLVRSHFQATKTNEIVHFDFLFIGASFPDPNCSQGWRIGLCGLEGIDEGDMKLHRDGQLGVEP